MKFLSSVGKKLELIVFILAFIAAIYMLIFFPARYFFIWHELPKSPEPVTKIIDANHMGGITIETITNRQFTCNIYSEKECWVEIRNNYETFSMGEFLCFKQNCPDKHIVQLIKATGQSHNFGQLSTIYSLHDDGMVFIKHTGFPYPAGIWMGTIIGGFCAFATYIGKSLFFGVFSLLR